MAFAFRAQSLIRIIRLSSAVSSSIRSSSGIVPNDKITAQNNQRVQFRTEDNLLFTEDPDNFGTLSRKVIHKEIPDDEDDIKEETFLQNVPLPTQKLTTKQYADLIKQNIKHKRLKEAIDILEDRMLVVDRVKPENYIYNILIGACADVGYTKKAFKLFNDMKRRGLAPTGDTYTCLFTACATSPWAADGLKNARHLKELMIEKGIEPNLTNYNAMIKAFGRCGDLSTAFKIADEMVSKKIKLRVHTLNHLLHACISDKQNGLRHALIVWRKILKLREKPNVYSFNLMLKCVKDCNLGTIDDLQELIAATQNSIMIQAPKGNIMLQGKTHQSPMLENLVNPSDPDNSEFKTQSLDSQSERKATQKNKHISDNSSNEVVTIDKSDNLNIEILDYSAKLSTTVLKERRAPNLLSKVPNMQEVKSLKIVHTVQDKFAVIGGQDDFLKEMEVYSVKPDIKTFTQMLMVIEDTREGELKLLENMKSSNVRADIDFYNMLIKKRSLRSDYEGALEVKQLIEAENKQRKKKHPAKKHLQLKLNIISYGVLAMACKTKEDAEKLLAEMREKQVKVNAEILGTLLRQGTSRSQFGYIMMIMNTVRAEKLNVNEVFLKHLEAFNDKCDAQIQKYEKGVQPPSEVFVKSHSIYRMFYKAWLKETDLDEVLTPEHPWQQFRSKQPETLQRQNIVIEEPKRFYSRKRRPHKSYTVPI